MANSEHVSDGREHLGAVEYLSFDERRRELGRLKNIASTLDSAVVLPGGYRIGLDGFIGLVPVVGDIVAAFISSFIVLRGAQLGVGTPHLLRMMLNILVEAVVGLVPVFGDLFDFVWKANEKNMALIERHLPEQSPRRSARKRLSFAALAVAGAFLILLVILVITAAKLLLAFLAAIF